MGIGKVSIVGDEAIFIVSNLQQLLKLLALFEIKPLNTTKHLNYLAFKEALSLYIENKLANNNIDLIMEKISSIKNTMNILKN